MCNITNVLGDVCDWSAVKPEKSFSVDPDIDDENNEGDERSQ